MVAIYHLSAKVIARGAGRSAVAAAAYRAAERLHDERLGRDHDFTAKVGVVHSEILLPEGAPERWGDRATLWNEVEVGERRKDAQLARDVEVALPRELSKAEAVALARALLLNPTIFVCDEPTNAMDVQAETAFTQYISHHSKNRTLILITHRQHAGGGACRGRDVLVNAGGGRLAACACQARGDNACDDAQSEAGLHVEENSTW